MFAPGSRDQTGCPICSHPDSAHFADGYDRLFELAPGRFALYRCQSCRCIYQRPFPPEALLPTFYPDEYWWSGSKGAGGAPSRAMNHLERIYREFVLRDHVRFLERCARSSDLSRRSLLDIGCGGGSFLHLAQRRGFVPHGMDSSAKAVAVASEQYGLPVREGHVGSDVWQGKQFHFITMFHVLEHLRDPLAALEYADGLLEPGGSLIIQVPNAGSIQAGVFGSRWYGLDVPRHVVNFTEKALACLVERAGFEISRRSRFSLRDNPASLASSVAPGLDPIGRRGRGRGPAISEAALEFLYLALFAASIPLALIEGLLGYGGTIWVEAKRRHEQGMQNAVLMLPPGQR